MVNHRFVHGAGMRQTNSKTKNKNSSGWLIGV